MSDVIAKHIVTVQRVVLMKRDNIEKRSADPRWPKPDLDVQRALLADLEDHLDWLVKLQKYAPEIRAVIAGRGD